MYLQFWFQFVFPSKALYCLGDEWGYRLTVECEDLGATAWQGGESVISSNTPSVAKPHHHRETLAKGKL